MVAKEIIMALCVLNPVHQYMPELSPADKLRLSVVGAVESHMSENVTSPAGALGPMQLMPIALEELRRTQADADCRPPAEPLASAQAQTYEHGLRWGHCYLEHLEQLGYTGAALFVAYNWGPGGARRWLRTGRMPRETARYVQRITETLTFCVEGASHGT